MFADDWLTVYQGDCRAVMASMEPESVHCVVTSPPYWGLRDYGTATWEGGDASCEHTSVRRPGEGDKSFTNGGTSRDKPTNVCRLCGAVRQDDQLGLEPTPEEYVANLVDVFREVRRVLRGDGTVWLNLGDSYAAGKSGRTDGDRSDYRGVPYGPRLKDAEQARTRPAPPGLKPKDLVGIPWMVARALQAPYYTGRIKSEADRAWLAGFLDGEGTISFVERDRGPDHTPTHDARVYVTNTDREPLDYFASLTAGHVYLHDDGTRENRYGSKPCYRWQMGTHDAALLLRELYPYLRTKRRQASLIWTLYTTLRHKNGHARTPDAVVAKRREIAEMVRSLNSGGDVVLPSWVEEPPSATEPGWYLRSDIIWSKANPMPESVTDRPTKSHEYLFLLSKSPRYYFDADAVREAHEHPEVNHISTRKRDGAEAAFMGNAPTNLGRAGNHEGGRNIRSVWTIATQPYAGSHFAVFPRKLVEPCIKAGTSERGVCPECGAPWVRVVEREKVATPRYATSYADAHGPDGRDALRASLNVTTTGWQPSCAHAADTIPATVLDPFAGSGTTGLVAQSLSRRAILIDLNGDYLVQAMGRNRDIPLGLVG